MANVITRTVYGAYLQTCQLLGLPVSINAFSTLNTKLGVQANAAIGVNDKPVMRYVTIGNGGHTMQMGGGGVALPQPVIHRATDAVLYNQIPFVVRPLTNDLTVIERANYRLRKLLDIGGVQHVAYYGKVLDITLTNPALSYNAVANGITTTSPFTPSNANQAPTPPAFNNGGTNVSVGDYVTASAKLPFTMTAADIVELINACTIMPGLGDANYAIISEIALCSGVDQSVTTDVTYTEVIGCQVMSFVSAFFPAVFTNQGFNVELDCGATEQILIPA